MLQRLSRFCYLLWRWWLYPPFCKNDIVSITRYIIERPCFRNYGTTAMVLSREFIWSKWKNLPKGYIYRLKIRGDRIITLHEDWLRYANVFEVSEWNYEIDITEVYHTDNTYKKPLSYYLSKNPWFAKRKSRD